MCVCECARERARPCSLPLSARALSNMRANCHTHTSNTVRQVIYALQERGDVQIETVALTMEPQGYHLDMHIVHMRNYRSASHDVANSRVSLPPAHYHHPHPLSALCRPSHLLPPRPLSRTALLLVTECSTRVQDDQDLQRATAEAGSWTASSGRDAGGDGGGGRDGHPDTFDESMVDEFAGLFQDSD